jgi:transcriptional regulator
MHPNSAFAWTDRPAMMAFVTETAFAHLFAQTPEGPMAAHLPVVVGTAGTLLFHLSRGNRLTPHLAGLTALASLADGSAYVSPDWYSIADQVPTWLYRAVEIAGPVRRLEREELVAQLDAASAVMEARLAPKPAWTRAKMSPGKFDAMLGGITGFELVPEHWRGTLKFNQHKPRADVVGMIAGLKESGRGEVAELAERYTKGR